MVINRYMKAYTSSVMLSALFCTLFLHTACNDSKKEPDVSKIKIELQTQRLDRDLGAIDTNQVAAGLQQLKQQYPSFLDFYLDTLMGFGIKGQYDEAAAGIRQGLRPFLSHKDIRGLFDTVASHFPDTKDIDADLTKGFQYMKYYYPDFHVPGIIYFISGLNNWAAFTYDTTITGIGLDMFLGPQYPFYKSVQLPEYAVKKCSPEYIPVNVFEAVWRDRHPFVMEGRSLLDMMLQRGKEQYFLSKVLPFTGDTLRLGFTTAQLQWCNSGEADIYNYFIRQGLLYETNWQKILRYINDGPSATGMSAESPGNVGTWLGWQIIKEYIKAHPGITPEALAGMEDAQKILQESRYKPR